MNIELKKRTLKEAFDYVIEKYQNGEINHNAAIVIIKTLDVEVLE